MSSVVEVSGRSVYGLAVDGLDHLRELQPRRSAPSGGASDPVLVDRRGGELVTPRALDDTGLVDPIGSANQWVVDRAGRRASLVGPEVPDDLVAHPCLAPVAVAFNRWAGRETFHAAAIVVEGRAFGIVGARTAGKSTLVAGMADLGVEVLADDLVVSDGSQVYAGPRCVDLRTPVPGLGLDTTSARLGTRWRLALPSVANAVPLGGWVFLRWGDEVDVRPCAAEDTLSRLAQWRGRRWLASDPRLFLDIGSRPGWELVRPRSWSEFADASRRLVETLASHVSAGTS